MANDGVISTMSGVLARLEARHGVRWPLIGLALVLQIAFLLALMTFYTWFRKTYFQQDPARAFQYALDIINAQDWLGLPVERIELRLQGWAIDNGRIDIFNRYYQLLKPTLYASAALCFLLAPVNFRRIRRLFLLTTAIAFPMYAIYPLAPPRLMQEYGFPFVDTVAIAKGISSTAESAGSANLYAAMPSMHIGWTTIAALWIAAAIPWKRVGLAIGILHLSMMALAVMITGNHYWLDIVGGWVAVALAWLIARQIPNDITWPWQRRDPSPDLPAPGSESLR